MRAWKLLSGFLTISLAGCLLSRGIVTLPSEDSLVRDQLVIHTNFQLPRHHRLVEELVARRHDIVDRLQLPVSDEPIHVYLFDSPTEFQTFMADRHPEFPTRRAFFVESDTRLTVYAYWGDRIAEDLRHEVTHGYLHTMVPHLPLWIDEGLAEYFEVPRGRRGLNQAHLHTLLTDLAENRWSPDLSRLEGIQSAADMAQRDYAEAWAWMHFLLESSPQRRDLLRNHLARIRMTGTAPPLFEVLAAVESASEQQLVDHLRRVAPQSPGPSRTGS
jgi:hypothetical protein